MKLLRGGYREKKGPGRKAWCTTMIRGQMHEEKPEKETRMSGQGVRGNSGWCGSWMPCDDVVSRAERVISCVCQMS